LFVKKKRDGGGRKAVHLSTGKKRQDPSVGGKIMKKTRP